jgi:hypothetical protein
MFFHILSGLCLIKLFFFRAGSPYSCKKCNKYIDRPSVLKAHEAIGCIEAAANVHRNKPKIEGKAKRKRRSSTPSSLVD